MNEDYLYQPDEPACRLCGDSDICAHHVVTDVRLKLQLLQLVSRDVWATLADARKATQLNAHEVAVISHADVDVYTLLLKLEQHLKDLGGQ